MNIEQRITDSGLFYFDDGYLGSTNHGVAYYEGYKVSDLKEDNLKCLVLNKEFVESEMFEDGLEIGDELYKDWDEFWNKWFGDFKNGYFEIIEDYNGGNLGYGKFTIDQVNKSITIEVVPCLYPRGWNDSEYQIFGFNDDDEVVRILNDEQLEEMMNEEKYFIG